MTSQVGSDSTRGVPPVPPITIPLRDYIRNFGQKTYTAADRAFAARTAPGSNRVEHHYYHRTTPWYYYDWNPVYVVPVGRGSSRQGDDAGRVLLGVTAAVVGGIAAYTIGSTLGELGESQEELEDARKVKSTLEEQQQKSLSETDRDALERALKAAKLKEKISQGMRDSTLIDLSLRIVLAAGCALALFGALFTVPPCMAIGAALGLSVAAGILFKWGFDNATVLKRERELEELKNLAGGLIS